jgi:hypothetical protein
MRPDPARYLALWSESFSAALPSIDEPDPAKAARAVDEAWEAADKAVRSFATETLVREAKAVELERERAERDAKRQATERARIEKEGYAALKKLLGKRIADQVELHAQYRIVRVGERLLAIPDAEGEAITTALRHAGGEVELTARAGPGWQLGKVVAPLDGELAAVVHGHEALAKAVELVRADVAQRREAEAAERERRAKALARQRRQDEQRRTYGTVVGDGDE